MSLYKWRGGKHVPAEFSANSYLDVYDGHVNTLNFVQMRHPGAYHSLMADLCAQARWVWCASCAVAIILYWLIAVSVLPDMEPCKYLSRDSILKNLKIKYHWLSQHQNNQPCCESLLFFHFISLTVLAVNSRHYIPYTQSHSDSKSLRQSFLLHFTLLFMSWCIFVPRY